MNTKSTLPRVRGTTQAAGAIALGAACIAAAAAMTPVRAAESIEEVVVHARKRAETVADIPLAITAITADALAQQSISQIYDVAKSAPNVFVKPAAGGHAGVEVSMRGQLVSQSNVQVDSPVGIYFDDVYVAQTKGAAVGMFDLQGVEISRGVQGTLFGRNNTGGAIVFYTRKPELGSYAAELSGTYGTNDTMRGHFIGNLPIGDTLAVRVGYSNMQQDPQGQSVRTGAGFSGQDQQLWRLSALWQPNERVSAHVVYENNAIDQEVVNRRAIPGTNIATALLAGTRNGLNTSGLQIPAATLFPSDFHDNSWNFVPDNDHVSVNFYRGTLSAELMPNLMAKVVVGYRTMNAAGGFDVDATPALNLESFHFGGGSQQFTVEPQISGKLFDDRLDWVAGYFHFEDDGNLRSNTFAYAVNNANPASPIRNKVAIDEKSLNESDAGYVHGEYALTPAWKIAAGVRYTVDTRELTPNRVFNPQTTNLCLVRLRTASPAPAAAPGGGCLDTTVTTDFDYWSWEASSHYRFNDQWSAYVRFGQGQKSGGYNTPLFALDAPAFKPEELNDYEFGVKASGLAGGTLGFSAAYFYGDYGNMQRLITVRLPGAGATTQTLTLNAGAATIQGIEVQFDWTPTDRLTVTGSTGWLDASYDEFIATDITAPGTGFDLSGQPFYYAPENSAYLGASYEIPLAAGKLRIGGGWRYQSDTSLAVIAYANAGQDAYSVFDARATWFSPDGRWEVSLFGTNLTDEEYLVGASVQSAGVDPSLIANSGSVIPGDERVIGGTVTWRWGQ
ncbi:MAG: TonB-dependent receptor [Gammaproteobacteria bacterium]